MGVTQTQRRLYRSGSRFAFWRWTFTPSGYLTRLFLAHTPWGGVMLHWINGPDPEDDPHNHPVTFLSLMLRGWYWELGQDDALLNASTKWVRVFRERYIRWYNFVRASTYIHFIKEVSPGGALTLVFYGPKRCDWGFFTPQGWVSWRDYNAKYRSPNNG